MRTYQTNVYKSDDLIIKGYYEERAEFTSTDIHYFVELDFVIRANGKLCTFSESFEVKHIEGNPMDYGKTMTFVDDNFAITECASSAMTALNTFLFALGYEHKNSILRTEGPVTDAIEKTLNIAYREYNVNRTTGVTYEEAVK